jgi:hypothetical protein
VPFKASRYFSFFPIARRTHVANHLH